MTVDTNAVINEFPGELCRSSVLPWGSHLQLQKRVLQEDCFLHTTCPLTPPKASKALIDTIQGPEGCRLGAAAPGPRLAHHMQDWQLTDRCAKQAPDAQGPQRRRSNLAPYDKQRLGWPSGFRRQSHPTTSPVHAHSCRQASTTGSARQPSATAARSAPDNRFNRLSDALAAQKPRRHTTKKNARDDKTIRPPAHREGSNRSHTGAQCCAACS